MRRRALPLALGGLFLALGVTTTAGTYALYSDFATSAGNRVAAASVSLGAGGSGGPSLRYPPLTVGVPARGEVTVDYRGTVAADVTLALTPGADGGFCERGPGGWRPVAGLAVVVTIGDAPAVDYCSLLDAAPVTLRAGVAPGSPPFTTAVDLTMTGNALAAPVTALDGLVVEASGGYTDRATGTLGATAEPVPAPPAGPPVVEQPSAAPPALAAALEAADPTAPLDPALVPEECRTAGMAFRADQVVRLTTAGTPWAADPARAAGPLLVFGTAGDDDITASAGIDCVVAGPGADRVQGGGGADVLLGGEGADRLAGGPGDDVLLGGAGADVLLGEEGADRFDGGPDGALCDGGVDGRPTGPRCDPPAPPITPDRGAGTPRGGAPSADAVPPADLAPPAQDVAPPGTGEPSAPPPAEEPPAPEPVEEPGPVAGE